MKKRLADYFRAGYPAIAIQTAEEARAMADILAASEEVDKSVVSWDSVNGGQLVRGQADTPGDDVLEALGARIPKTIYVLNDLQVYPLGEDPQLNRACKELVLWCRDNGSTVVFLGADFKPPSTFSRLVVVLDYLLPDRETVERILDGSLESIKEAGEELKLDNGLRDQVIGAAMGMSTAEAENAFFLSYIEKKSLDPQVIYREKVQAVRRSGLLELIEPDPLGMDAVGGLDHLKEYIRLRKQAFTKEARDFGLPLPKGTLICGVSGTGKSLSAKAAGIVLGIPTLKFDIGSLFGSLVGESERRTRETLALAEAVSPCVLWIEELDKALAGSRGGGESDSGVTKRVFGTLISWMQDHTTPVFICATANAVQTLPPELLRKGRWDELFFVDLPSFDDRKNIFGIHLKKRGRKAEDYDIEGLAAKTEGHTGAEIEQAIITGLYRAFDTGKELQDADIEYAIENTVPLSETMKEDIDELRNWAKNRARPASSSGKQVVKLPQLGTRKLSN